MAEHAKFTPLPPRASTDSSSGDTDEDEKLLVTGRSPAAWKNGPDERWAARRLSPWLLLAISAVNVMVLALSVWLFVLSRSPGLWSSTVRPLNADLRRISTWCEFALPTPCLDDGRDTLTLKTAPLFDLVDLDMHERQVNGTIYPNAPNPAETRQFPNPAAEAVWDEWENQRVFPITAAQVRKLGKSTDTAIRLDAKFFGEGWKEDMYAGQLDVFHQLHCLNSLRQAGYRGYYNESPPFNADIHQSTIHEVHFNHCIDIIAQALKCSANLDIITVHWGWHMRAPSPDFSVNKRCINFDALVDWRKQNTIDSDLFTRYVEKSLPGPGHPRMPDPMPEWWPGRHGT